jgi:hypothetical protein
VRAEEHLRWVEITPETLCLRGVATCCYSSLFVENLSILGPKMVCIDVDFCKFEGAEPCAVTAQIFEKDVPINRKHAVCDGFNGARFAGGPEDTPAWPDVVPTMSPTARARRIREELAPAISACIWGIYPRGAFLLDDSGKNVCRFPKRSGLGFCTWLALRQ